MKKRNTDVSALPEHFDLPAFQSIANIRSADPREFVRRYLRHCSPEKVSIHHFGSGMRTASLVDRGSNVLMVAHVDTVQEAGGLASVRGFRLRHRTIDNRLGVYLGLHLLPSMGLSCDLLLTTDEEVGSSTAALAIPLRQYNWAFSFDRGGDDAVCYQYTSDTLTDVLAQSGIRVEEGNYSCIAEMDHFGCPGINFGCGMADYHERTAYCDLRQLNRQLLRFRHFYHSQAGNRFANVVPGRPSTSIGRSLRASLFVNR